MNPRDYLSLAVIIKATPKNGEGNISATDRERIGRNLAKAIAGVIGPNLAPDNVVLKQWHINGGGKTLESGNSDTFESDRRNPVLLRVVNLDTR